MRRGIHCWREFVGERDDLFVTVLVWELVRGDDYEPKNGRLIRIAHVTHERAVELLEAVPS